MGSKNKIKFGQSDVSQDDVSQDHGPREEYHNDAFKNDQEFHSVEMHVENYYNSLSSLLSYWKYDGSEDKKSIKH